MNATLLRGFKPDVPSGTWSPILTDGTATVVKFDRRGQFMAVGTRDGRVRIFDMNLVPVSLTELVPTDRRDMQSITSLSWCKNSRHIVVAFANGSCAVWDVASRALLQRFAYPTEFKTGQVGCTVEFGSNDEIMLNVITAEPMLWTGDDTYRMLPHAVVERVAPKHRTLPHVEARFVYHGARIAVLSSRGELSLVEVDTLDIIYSVLVGPMAFVAMCVGGNGSWVGCTGRNGLVLYSTEDLSFVEKGGKGYKELVELIAFAGCFAAPDGVTLVAIPTVKTSAVQYFFRRDLDGYLKTVPSPEPLVHTMHADWHPTRPMFVICTTNGNVHALEQQYDSHWIGCMYPPGYQLIIDNVEHIEAEDEFDRVDETGATVVQPIRNYLKAKPTPAPTTDGDVDMALETKTDEFLRAVDEDVDVDISSDPALPVLLHGTADAVAASCPVRACPDWHSSCTTLSPLVWLPSHVVAEEVRDVKAAGVAQVWPICRSPSSRSEANK